MGPLDKVDGAHAAYNAEMRDALRALGYTVEAASKFQRLSDNHEYDYHFITRNPAGP